MKTNYLYKLFFCSLLSILLNSCKNEKIETPVEENTIVLLNNGNNNLSASYRSGLLDLYYEAKTIGDITESTITVKNKDNNIVYRSEYVINTDLKAYKLASHESVISQADKVKLLFPNEIKNIHSFF
jgi:hypothetical protein